VLSVILGIVLRTLEPDLETDYDSDDDAIVPVRLPLLRNQCAQHAPDYVSLLNMESSFAKKKYGVFIFGSMDYLYVNRVGWRCIERSDLHLPESYMASRTHSYFEINTCTLLSSVSSPCCLIAFEVEAVKPASDVTL
jgi:hypothetical protein